MSVVIPVRNAEPYLAALLDALHRQRSVAPGEIVLIDSASTDRTRAIAARDPKVRWIPIEKFSHGRARNLGTQACTSETVVFMSQDALPRDEFWLARLLEPFQDGQVAAAYSRQVPRDDATPMERFFLADRFPGGPIVRRTARPGEVLSLEKVFLSNVSAAVRRNLLLAHPFDERLIMSEDQQLSRDLLKAGYAVVYQPASVVIHSHRYTLGDVFRRYFDSVYSLRHVFPEHDVHVSIRIGRRYVAQEMKYIASRYPAWLPYYALYTAAKSSATVLAHAADRLPRWLVKRMSLHSEYWNQTADRTDAKGAGRP